MNQTYKVFQQIFQGDGNQCWRSVLSDRAGEEDEEPEGPDPCLHRILQHSFTLVNTIDKYDKQLPSVPEEIVDNSDLGDPEGMLQLSRVRFQTIILKTFLQTMDPKLFNSMTNKLIGNRPNSYTYTKVAIPMIMI